MTPTKINVLLYHINARVSSRLSQERLAGYSQQTGATAHIQYHIVLFVLQMKEHQGLENPDDVSPFSIGMLATASIFYTRNQAYISGPAHLVPIQGDI